MTFRRLAVNIIFSSCLLLMSNITKAQNLFVNAGFEEINLCVEHTAFCAPEAWFNIPATNILVNSKIAPVPKFGQMALVVPVGNVLANFNKPRYVYTAFCCPLVAGAKYSLSFYLSTTTVKFKQLAFYFTEKEPTFENINNLIHTPSIVVTPRQIDADSGSIWKHVHCGYTATGNERFCIITTAGFPIVEYEMKDAMNKSGDVLNFIDEIVFKSDSTMPVCPGYEIIKQSLYNQNYRHRDDILALPEVIKLPEIKPVVHFKNDTLTIAALLFDVNKFNIKPYVKKILDSLVQVLGQKKFLKIEVSGHTDNSGNQKNNQTLSEARAISIQQYIILQLPQFAEKIHATGKGQDFPIATNDTEAGREKNRRVEVVITYIDIVK
jgi:outer membrane protein OmpA-like peptidoglycan-associated protein